VQGAIVPPRSKPVGRPDPEAPHVLQVRLLGDPEVRFDGCRVESLASARPLSLLAYLIVNRDRAPCRQRIACTFWPDSSESQARTNLRQALHNLRHALPDPDRSLALDGQSVQWLADAPATVDLIEFEDAASHVETSGERPSLERAVALYAGDLLPGCYDDWIGPKREQLRQRCIGMLEQLATLADRDGDRVAALRSTHQLLHLDPLHEASYRRLMRLHLDTGERARAVRVYHACASTLERELDVSPCSETVELYEHLLVHGAGDPSDRRRAPVVEDAGAGSAPAIAKYM
jgi:DNA-binding SARP family transcriptional activator